MKKLLFTLSIFTLLMSYETAVAQNIYPKSCLSITHKTELNKSPRYGFGAFHITTSKASISQPILPIGLVEGTINDGNLQAGALLAVGAGWMWGVTNVTIYEDSTILTTGTAGGGIVVVYGQSTLTSQQSLILAGVVSYSGFILGPGVDLKAPSNMFRIVMSGNLSAILPKIWTSIKL